MAPRYSDLGLARVAIELTLRVGLLLALVGWCVWLMLPFIEPLVWGTIIAIAVHPGYETLSARLGGRHRLAAVIVTVAGLVILSGPLSVLTMSLIDTIAIMTERMGVDIAIPPPPPQLQQIPLVGEPIAQLWTLASVNLGAALAQIGPQLRVAAGWLLALVADAGFSLVKFVVAIVIAGVLLAHSRRAAAAAHALAERLVGKRGPQFADLAEQTVRNVTRGLLGTALIQSMLAGLGLLLAGVPGAAFLALIVFLLCVVQIGPVLVMVPALVWTFLNADTLTFVLLLVWALFVGTIDNFLRPYLMSRGSAVPMLVILIGVIGGLLAHGLIGLFIGPIVLALGYELLRAWVIHPGRGKEGGGQA
ncbi:MAG TPA: AI-2E family transporter [Geminicoccaceae bacterium]|nr:AI-2E family transporter [Geminicoccus sp.]HMU48723.1 AI-2E family transporter [Geminicoccaceae bacterium]